MNIINIIKILYTHIFKHILQVLKKYKIIHVQNGYAYNLTGFSSDFRLFYIARNETTGKIEKRFK